MPHPIYREGNRGPEAATSPGSGALGVLWDAVRSQGNSGYKSGACQRWTHSFICSAIRY